MHKKVLFSKWWWWWWNPQQSDGKSGKRAILWVQLTILDNIQDDLMKIEIYIRF